jgi:hypothetical protein
MSAKKWCCGEGRPGYGKARLLPAHLDVNNKSPPNRFRPEGETSDGQVEWLTLREGYDVGCEVRCAETLG